MPSAVAVNLVFCVMFTTRELHAANKLLHFLSLNIYFFD